MLASDHMHAKASGPACSAWVRHLQLLADHCESFCLPLPFHKYAVVVLHWLFTRIERLRASIALVPFRVKFSSMSESTQTSQDDLCDAKRCSCVVFSLKAGRKDLTNRPKVLSPHSPPPPPPIPIAPPSWKNAEFGYTRYGHPVLPYTAKKTAKILLTSFGGTEGGGGG